MRTYIPGLDLELQTMRSNTMRLAIGLICEEMYRLLLSILFVGSGLGGIEYAEGGRKFVELIAIPQSARLRRITDTYIFTRGCKARQ